MKKLLLSVFTLAILITSCNKYANDFQALKDQIAALSLKVDGVTALTTQLGLVKDQITTLQGAVAALPTAASITSLASALTAQGNTITAIQSKLNDLASTGATSASVTALAAQLTKIASDKVAADAVTAAALAALQTKLDAAASKADVTATQSAILTAILNSASTTDLAVTAQIATLKADILQGIKDGSADVNSKIAALQAIVADANAASAAKLNTLITNLGNLQTTTDANNTALQLSITGLNMALAAAQRDLTILLNASAMYNDNVNISTDSDVAFYLAKLYQMGIINGNLIVNTAAITSIADLNKILGAVVAVIGTNDAVQVITSGNRRNDHTVWTLTTIAGSGHFVNIDSQASDMLAAGLLTSIRGDYTVTGSDISDPKIDNVGGTVTYDYPGAYESISLKTVGQDLTLVAASGNINFPNVIVGHFVSDATGPADGNVIFSAVGTDKINFGLATTPVIKNLTAANATGIVLGYEDIQGLTVVAPKALTIDFPAAVSSHGGIWITTWAPTAVNLAKLATSTGDVSIVNQNGAVYYNGTVDLTAFNSPVHLTITGPQVITLPSLVDATLSASKALNVTLAVFEWASVPSLPAVQVLTLGNVKHNVNIGTYSLTLLEAYITGNDPADGKYASIVGAAGVSTTLSSVLTTLKLNGVYDVVSLSMLPKLTTFTTAGVINSLTLDQAAIITGVSFDHKAFVGNLGTGGPGSDLTLTTNAKLADVMPTALDYLHSLYVVGNSKLASFDFSSYKTVLASAVSVSIVINAPATMGTYTHSIAPTGANNPGIQAKIVSAEIQTILPYVKAALANAHVNATSASINIGITGGTDLATAMNGDQTPFGFGYTNNVVGFSPLEGSSVAGVLAAGVSAELALVQ